MPRMPRDVSHKSLCTVLGKYGYTISRQTGILQAQNPNRSGIIPEYLSMLYPL